MIHVLLLYSAIFLLISVTGLVMLTLIHLVAYGNFNGFEDHKLRRACIMVSTTVALWGIMLVLITKLSGC